MADLRMATARLRESVAAILKIRPTKRTNPAKVEVGWGSAFCVSTDKYLMTAFHILNDGKPRDPAAKYYALTVPNNDDPVFAFPVVGFALERPDFDMAILEIGPCMSPGIHLPGIPVTFARQPDGTQALTVGFPAPEIAGLNADSEGNFRGGQFFLKSHANEGIVAAQYDMPNHLHAYELNIGWHHGESGGPIAIAAEQPVVFSLMQHYRNIQGPHGLMPGPRRGFALAMLQDEMQGLGIAGI